MELAGLEPAPSWVRSSRPLTSKVPRLQRFMGERLECRNISRNSLHRVLQRHEILDRLPAPSKRSGASTSWVRSPKVPLGADLAVPDRRNSLRYPHLSGGFGMACAPSPKRPPLIPPAGYFVSAVIRSTPPNA